MTLAEFLLARIAEDESDARNEQGGNIPTDCWGPERVLAECEARRRIVHMGGGDVVTEDYDEAHGEALSHLGAVYSDHPEYRGEWRP